MSNNQKKIDKLNQHIIALEKERRDHLTLKSNKVGEINLAATQKKIDDARAKVENLRKANPTERRT